MIDYKQMYLELFRSTSDAIDILIDAQRKVEEIYINQTPTKISEIKNEIIDK